MFKISKTEKFIKISFKYSIWIFLVFFLFSLISIIISSKSIKLFDTDFTEKGWYHFVYVFFFPISIAGIIVTVYTILTSLSRLYQHDKTLKANKRLLLFNKEALLLNKKTLLNNENAFKLSKQAFESTYRPFLSTVELNHIPESDQFLNVYFITQNFGQFPAKILSIEWTLLKDNAEVDNQINLKKLYIILPSDKERIETASSKKIFSENYFYKGTIEIKSIIHYQGLNNSFYKTEMKHNYNNKTKKYSLIECNWY